MHWLDLVIQQGSFEWITFNSSLYNISCEFLLQIARTGFERIRFYISLRTIKPEIVHTVAQNMKDSFFGTSIFVSVSLHVLSCFSCYTIHKLKPIVFAQKQPLYVHCHYLPDFLYLPHLFFHKRNSLQFVTQHIVLGCLQDKTGQDIERLIKPQLMAAWHGLQSYTLVWSLTLMYGIGKGTYENFDAFGQCKSECLRNLKSRQWLWS